MAKNKSWDELELSNDFLFAKVMRNSELCKEMIEKLLDLNIERIEYPEEQKQIDITLDARSVRLDVYVRDDKNTVYNIEIQTSDTKELPKRSRYYQGMIDLNLIEKGEHFKNLNTSYVIFICTFDLFKKGLHRYTFENICKEDTAIGLGDKAIKLFFNTKGTADDVSMEVASFLKYVDGMNSEDDFVKKLEQEVQKIKGNEEWRREYMTLFMRDQENIERGREEGLKEGRRTERLVIIRQMHQNGVQDENIAKILNLSIEEVKNILDNGTL